MVRKFFPAFEYFHWVLYNIYSHCTDLSSSCICHTFDTQLSQWDSTWQLPGGGWHWKRTVSPVVAPGNDCRKLRHPPSVGQTLSPHQSRPSHFTLGRIRLLLLTSSSTEASTLTLHQGRPKHLVKYLDPPSFSSQPDSTYILKSSLERFESTKSQAGKQTE